MMHCGSTFAALRSRSRPRFGVQSARNSAARARLNPSGLAPTSAPTRATKLQASELLRGGGAAVEIHGQIDQSTHSHAGAAFAGPGLGIVEPGGAGNIEVHPRRVAGKFTEEPSGNDGASAAPAAHILNISDGALDQVVVVLIERHGPHFLAGAARAGE